MEEIDLKDLVGAFWNKRYKIITIIIMFIVIGCVYSYLFITPKYSSSTTLVLAGTATNEGKENSITTTDVALNSKLVSTYSELVKSKNVLSEVIENLKIDEKEEYLKKNITVSSVEDTEIIKITVAHENSAYAAKIANELAKVFTNKVNEIYNIDNVYIVDKAEENDNPSNINHLKDIIVFSFGGIVVAAIYVVILNLLDNTIKTAEEIEKGYGIPVLVSIPSIESFDNERIIKGGKRR